MISLLLQIVVLACCFFSGGAYFLMVKLRDRFKHPKLFKLSVLLFLVGVALFVWGIGAMSFFALPVFSSFFWISQGTAHTLAYVSVIGSFLIVASSFIIAALLSKPMGVQAKVRAKTQDCLDGEDELERYVPMPLPTRVQSDASQVGGDSGEIIECPPGTIIITGDGSTIHTKQIYEVRLPKKEKPPEPPTPIVEVPKAMPLPPANTKGNKKQERRYFNA